ncbi:hypothetical protein ABFS83_14G002200 [Erythranthe nasuta]
MEHQQHHQGATASMSMSMNSSSEEEMMMEEEVRRGPWTVEEDLTLINYIAHHGEGRWNSLARCAGLKRTGKSCRLRWLNYLRPDVRRGNITLEEQLLILELHSRWGNRWSKIAQHLPGRTDNEIKNYWRTRVQKHAKQLKCDVNSKQFKDTMRYLWMPRLVERIQSQAQAQAQPNNTSLPSSSSSTTTTDQNIHHLLPHQQQPNISAATVHTNYTPENSSDSFGTPASDLTADHCYNNYPINHHHQQQGHNNNINININQEYYPLVLNNDADNHHQLYSDNNDQYQSSSLIISPTTAGYFNQQLGGGLGLDLSTEQNSSQLWMDGGSADALSDDLWNNVDDIWFLQQQFNFTTNNHFI